MTARTPAAIGAFSLYLLSSCTTSDGGDAFGSGDGPTGPSSDGSGGDGDTDGAGSDGVGTTGGEGSSSGAVSSGGSTTTGDDSTSGSGPGTGSGGSTTTGDGGPRCGDGTLDEGETCDSNVFGGLDCEDFESPGGLTYTGGTLECRPDCSIDPGGCYVCGDGMLGGSEVCDGGDLGSATCITEGFDGGTLACNGTCDGFDVDMCTRCGDGTVDPSEECDGGVDGRTCEDEGFEGGELLCDSDCRYSTENCFACGDGVRSGPEVCDCGMQSGPCNTAQIGGMQCIDLPAPGGGNYSGGQLQCGSPTDCMTIDESACTWCGDGVKNGEEDCEGSDFGDETCLSRGFLGGGDLGCNADCTADESGCVGPQCGVQAPPADPMCPAVCTGGCTTDTCNVDCIGDFMNDACNNTTIDCPDGWICNVTCDRGCDGLVVNCDDDSVCSVTCDGISTCDAPGVTLNCGTNECAATCGFFNTGSIDTQCGDSCGCTPC